MLGSLILCVPTIDIEGYNVANQLIHDGTNTLTYDDNGNLTSDGVNSYTWDRANHLLSVGSTAYHYDGVGNRIRQTVSSIITDYLNDVQPGLTKLLAQTTGANTERFIHAPRGIHAMEDNSGNWTYPVQDGLGSVRGVVSDALAVNGMQNYAPYGDPFGAQGSLGMDFGFTGEQTDGSGQVYLRKRYYTPSIGVFNSLDPFEGLMRRPMSLNGYSWVEGNVVNAVDPTGNQMCPDDCDKLRGVLSSGILRAMGCLPPLPTLTSCVVNSPNRDRYINNDLWNCSGSGHGYTCQEWLDEAHCILSEGTASFSPGDRMRQAVRVLDEIQSRRIRIEFDLNSCCGAWGREFNFPLPIIENTLSMYRLDLSPDITLVGHPEQFTLELVSNLVHESVHAGQRHSIAPNIRNEVEAYIIQWIVMDEMGLAIDNWQRAFENFFEGDDVTHNFDALCDARKIILTCQSHVYDYYMLDLDLSATLCGIAHTPVYDGLVSSGVITATGCS